MSLGATKFGLSTSYDLFQKLKHDSELLLRQRPETYDEQRLEEYEAFNFFITAWHLHKDWLGSETIKNPFIHCLKYQQPIRI